MKKLRYFLALILVICLCACGGSSNLDELLELGAKYLDEQNYEEAIIAFTQAIEIDEKCAQAYIGLADAYICTEEYDKAEEILKKGYELTGDKKLKKMLNELKNSGYGIVTEDFLRMEELTIGGRPFYEMTIQDARKAVPDESGFNDEIIVNENGSYYVPDKVTSTTTNTTTIGGKFHISQSSGVGHIDGICYEFDFGKYSEKYFFQPEVRKIKGGQTFDTVLRTLGFTKEGVEMVRKSCEENDIDKNMISTGNVCKFTRKKAESDDVEWVLISAYTFDNHKVVSIDFQQSMYYVDIELWFSEGLLRVDFEAVYN